MDALQAAFGLSEVIDENMANAARMHAVENGEDLSEYSMIAFGGAAPLHGARLCEKLGISTCLVPLGAGVGSAIGFLKAPFSFEAVRSDYQRMSSLDTGHIRSLVKSLAEEAGKHVSPAAGKHTEILECKAFMRYVGQGWEIPVYLDTGAGLDNIGNWTVQYLVSEFESAYRALFSRTVADLDIEIASWAVRKSLAVPAPDRLKPADATDKIEMTRTREMFSSAKREFVSGGLCHRDDISAGQSASGPCAIIESETTTIVPDGCWCDVQADGSLKITLSDAHSSTPTSHGENNT